MENKINLNSPFRTVILKILSYDPQETSLFGRNEHNDVFFQDLVTIGVDFYELLELFISSDAITKHSAAFIIESAPTAEILNEPTEKELRRIIPHWTGSKYHTAPIDEVLCELQQRIKECETGAYVYNSNKNSSNKRAYNDIYVLIVADNSMFFFDINRRKAYKIQQGADDK